MTTAPRHRLAHSIASSAPTKPQPQSLARRLLLPPHSSDDLPPLLARSPDAHPELTAELYDFIALALRAYVNPWWTKLTRYDKEFLPHINRIIIHVIRVLEVRIQNTQLESLAFHDLPTLLTQHYVDFRNAQSKIATSYATGGAASLSQLFAQNQPHMAVSSDGTIDAEYYRQTVDLILKVCLPPEDYEPEVERVIVREVIVKVLVGAIIPKVTQPWFIQKTMLDLIGPIDDEPYLPVRSSALASSDTSTFQSMIIIILSALQSFSGTCLALIHSYKQAITTIKLVNQSPSQPPPDPSELPPSPLMATPPQLSRANSAVRDSPSLAPSQTISDKSSTSSSKGLSAYPPPAATLASPPPPIPQDYAATPLAMMSEIINSKDRFASTLFLSTISMASASMTPFLDKLLPYLLRNFLSPTFILNITRLSKGTMFPNGYPGPPPMEPTPEEQAQIRAKLLAWRGKGAISHLLPIILGPDPSATLSTALDPIGDAQCNARLLVFILDRILVTIFPELVN